MWERLRAALTWEDAALFVIGVVAPPIFFPEGDAGPGLGDPGAGWGALYVIASLGALGALVTRSEGEPVMDMTGSDAMTPRMYAPLPFMVGLAIVSSTGFDAVGLGAAGAFAGLVFVLSIGSLFWGKYLPAVSGEVRRHLISPFVLVASGIFAGLVADTEDAFDIVALLDAAGGDPTLSFYAIALPAIVAGLFYAMFVFAPRQLAERDTSWAVWLLRYGTWFVGTVAGVAVAQAL